MPDVRILKTKSYLAMIRNAAKGENYMFRNLYALVDGVEQDINQDGVLACSFFASAVLYINKLIKDMHAGVTGLERDLVASGWERIDEPREGAVLLWEAQNAHRHIGFSLGNGRAVSNASGGSGVPTEHSDTYDGTRKIESIWLHPSLK